MNIEQKPQFNEMQTVKRRLFAMRNGVIADTLRKAGSPFRIIFGVNLPQLIEIAHDTGQNRELALRLWENDSTRESMLLAPMLMPVSEFTIDDAYTWVRAVNTTEVADILCHRLLRNTPYALALAKDLAESDDEMTHYIALRLMCNIGSKYPFEALTMGEKELTIGNPRTHLLAVQLTLFADDIL